MFMHLNRMTEQILKGRVFLKRYIPHVFARPDSSGITRITLVGN